MILRNSWYLNKELATLSLFSYLVSDEQKSTLVLSMKKYRSSLHLLEKLPLNLDDFCISHSFFATVEIEDSFLTVPVKDWPQTPSYKIAAIFTKNLVCVNDVVVQAVALLIKDFNCATKNEQKQLLL
ncbi:hypothetical protein AVEN_121269-1 [Araneus ventricosus]|uniref:Uncharacterized protein n=1 Tax=Araneus ventricosus TaxID=182803 RepID=A0A4Y2Q9Y7_ARAVE|nr:hypothetical protein AVEN_121269-1 [Araneus ventricosus]